MGHPLLHITGIAEIGPPDGEVITGTLAASNAHGLSAEELSAKELMRKWPAFAVPSNYVAVVQDDGGFIEVDPAIQAFRQGASACGAHLRNGVTVRAVEPTATGVRIVTEGEIVEAEKAIITVGPWLKKLLPTFPAPLRTTRQVLGWFEPVDPTLFKIDSGFPVFIIENRHGIHYGFPSDYDGLVKIAKHHHFDEKVDPDNYDHTVTNKDESAIRSAIADYLPAANGRMRNSVTCLYTRTSDDFFVIDHIDTNIQIASPCSGHGFKFAPVIGEILADLAIDGATRHDIRPFRLDRFG